MHQHIINKDNPFPCTCSLPGIKVTFFFTIVFMDGKRRFWIKMGYATLIKPSILQKDNIYVSGRSVMINSFMSTKPFKILGKGNDRNTEKNPKNVWFLCQGEKERQRWLKKEPFFLTQLYLLTLNQLFLLLCKSVSGIGWWDSISQGSVFIIKAYINYSLGNCLGSDIYL